MGGTITRNQIHAATLLAAVLLVLAPLSPALARRAETRANGRVVEVVDGDTVSVKVGTRTLRVRLYGIDAPELRQPFGREAKTHTARLTLGKPVTLIIKDRDRYQRTVAELEVGDGQSLSRELVRAGLAWRHSGRRKLYRDEENEARSAGRGLWSQPNPVPPWEFRRQHP